MGKSKNFRPIRLRDGGTAVFDWTAFREAVDKAKRKRPYKGIAMEVFRSLAKELFPQQAADEDAVENMANTIKNWYGGNNGPSLEEKEIHTMEQFLGCEAGSFLKRVDHNTETEKEYEDMDEMNANVQSVNMDALAHHLEQLVEAVKAGNAPGSKADVQSANTSNFLTIQAGSRILKNALRSMREKEAAHELYGLFVDAIWEYSKVDHEIYNCKLYDKLIDELAFPEDEEKKKWQFTPEQFQQFKEQLRKLPRRMSLENAVEKYSLFLPKELRYRLSQLLDELYGDREDFLEEPGSSWKEDWLCRVFMGAKVSQLENYLNGCLSKEYDEDDVMCEVYSFFNWEVDELMFKLNDIFSDYLCE